MSSKLQPADGEETDRPKLRTIKPRSSTKIDSAKDLYEMIKNRPKKSLRDRLEGYQDRREKELMQGKVLPGLKPAKFRRQKNESQRDPNDDLLKFRVNPEGNFKKFWESLKFVLLIYTFLYLPVKVAFIEDSSIYMYVMDKFIDAIFFIDIILTFLTPVYVKIEMVFGLKEIAWEYITGWFFIDVIAMIPFEDIVSSMDVNDKITFLAQMSKILRLLRLFKLMRLFKAFDFTNADNYFLKVMESKFKGTVVYLLLPNLMLMTFTIHFFSCFWYLLATLDDSNDNWVVINHFQDEPPFDLYIISFYFVIQTFTSCGYGDIYSHLNIELIFRIIVMFFGVFLYGIFSGRIVDYRSQKMTDEEHLAKKIQALERINSRFGLSTVTFQSILEKLSETKSEEKKRYDFSNLTPEELDRFEHYKYISKFSGNKLFPQAEEYSRFVLELGRMMTERNYNKDQVIFNHGDPAVFFYIIRKGKVRLLNKQLELIPIYEIRNGFFGEYEIIFGTTRQYTAVAETDCQLYLVDIINFKRFFLTEAKDLDFREAFIIAAHVRMNAVHKAQADFDFFMRRKMFWKIVLRESRSKHKGFWKTCCKKKNMVKIISS
jgi:hypothetical protein